MMDFNEALSHVRTSGILTGRLSRRSVFMYLMRSAQGLILSEAPVAVAMVMLLQPMQAPQPGQETCLTVSSISVTR